MSVDEKSISLFQDFVRNYPPCPNDVCPFSTVVAPSRGFARCARHRHLPRDDTSLVESVRSDFSVGNQKEVVSNDARPNLMALAFGRNFRSYQQRNILPLASCRSRGRGSRRFRYKTAGSQGGIEVFAQNDETSRTSKGDCDKQTSVLPSRDERDRQRGPTRDGALAQQ